MRRTVALLLVLAVLAGAMVYIHTKIWQMEDDVVFTEHILAGDARWMEGETADIHYDAGAYLSWDCEYRFGETPSVQSVFHLSQKQNQDWMFSPENEFYISRHIGHSMWMLHSKEGDTQLQGHPFYQMIRAAAVQTPPGEPRELDFRTIDYLEDYPYGIYLNYLTPSRSCNTSADFLSDSMDQDLPDIQFYKAFIEKFRFPVSETDITHLSVHQKSEDYIKAVEVNQQEENDYGFLSAIDENGLYLIPYFEDAEGNPLKGDYSDGRGLYFLPWRIQSDTTFQSTVDGETVQGYGVWPDLAHSRNLFPIADDIHVSGFELSQDSATAWIVTREDDGYYLNVLNIPDGTLRSHIFLMERENEPTQSSVLVENGYMIVAAGQKLALVNLEGDCHLEFSVDSGAAQDYMNSLCEHPAPYLRYEDGVLTILNAANHVNCYFYTAVFNADGLQFLADYACNLDDRADSSVLYFQNSQKNPVTLR